jgi:MtN3 and saliva related transmembrane protein
VHTFLASATTGWGVLMALAPLLQVRIVIRRRNSEGASATWIVILLVGFILWLCYGISTGDRPLIITNSASSLIALATLAVIVRYRPRKADGIVINNHGKGD